MAEAQKTMPQNQHLQTSLGAVDKKVSERGSLQLYRHKQIANFQCHHCHKDKTSKLAAFKDASLSEPVCNGCHGQINVQQSLVNRQNGNVANCSFYAVEVISETSGFCTARSKRMP
jgi:hypothetical protein